MGLLFCVEVLLEQFVQALFADTAGASPLAFDLIKQCFGNLQFAAPATRYLRILRVATLVWLFTARADLRVSHVLRVG